MRAHGPTRRASGVQLAWLHGGRRLHLQHGPIDLIALAEGPPQAVRQAYRQAVDAFDSVLQDLVGELPLLRRDVGAAARPVGDIARAMHEAARRVRHAGFASPMIAVAGAVADHILRCMLRDNPCLTRASVNNGGDIAMYLAGSSAFEIGLVADPQRGEQIGTIRIGVADAPRGVATSGWRGRSHSLGIADAVTVLADCAASADAAGHRRGRRVVGR